MVLALTADAPSARAFRIYFIGDELEPTKKSYHTLLRSIAKYQPHLTQKIQFTYATPGQEKGNTATRFKDIGRQRPDLVVALNGLHAAAVRRHLPDVQLVFSSFDDPIQYGIVTDLHSRPEPVCGISLTDKLEAKRFEILRQSFPDAVNIAVLADSVWSEELGGRIRAQTEAERQGLKTSFFIAESPGEVQELFAKLSPSQHDAWYIPATFVTDHSTKTIIDSLTAWRKPNLWTATSEVEQGALMAYSQEHDFVWPSLAELITRIYSGERPEKIPILRPRTFKLTVRAKPLSGLPLPHLNIMRRANYIIR